MTYTLHVLMRFILISLCLVTLPSCTLPWDGYIEKQLPQGVVKLPRLNGYLPVCESDPDVAARSAETAKGQSLLTCFVNEEKHKRYRNREITSDEVFPIMYIATVDKNPTGNLIATTEDLDLLKTAAISTYKLINTPDAGSHGFTFIKSKPFNSKQIMSSELRYQNKTMTVFLSSNSILVLTIVSRSSRQDIDAAVLGDLNLWLQEFNRLNSKGS